jgi:hypothetical protein
VERGISGRQFCASQKGGAAVGKTKRGKGTKWMVLVDGQGLPLGVRLESVSPGEATLADATSCPVTRLGLDWVLSAVRDLTPET